MFILAIIPARAGSKGIKDKNIYPLCGKPLIEYTINTVKGSTVDDYRITTNITEVINRYDKVRIRPEYLCTDNSKSIDTVKHTVQQYEKAEKIKVDAVLLLQPTSPLRTTEDINRAIEIYKWYNKIDNLFDSLYSGYYMGIKHKDKTYDKHIDKPHFQRNGAIFIAKRHLIDQGKLWSENVIEFEMPYSRSVDIDNLDDMYLAECVLKNPKEVKR